MPLRDGSIIVGRSKGDIIIPDPRISRSHVALHFEGKTGRLTFTDLKSLNGTVVNGEASGSGQLRDGDKIQLGDTVLDCQILSPEETTGKSRSLVEKLKHFSKKEPELLPLEDEERALQENLKKEEIEHTQTRRHAPQRSFFSVYRSLQPRTRRISLLGLLLCFIMVYFRLGDSPTVSIERELASIKELQSHGKTREALILANELSKKHPKGIPIYLMLGDLYRADGNREAALDSFRKARELDPKQTHALVSLIRIYMESGFEDQAHRELALLDGLLLAGPKTESFYEEAAKLYLDLRSFDKVFQLSKILQTELAPEKVTGYKLEAQGWIAQNRATEALTALEKALRYSPDDEWILESLAITKLQLKDYNGAQQSVETWLGLHPNNQKGLLLQAYLRYNDQKYHEALPPLEKILDLAPSDSPVYLEGLNLMGQVYLQLEQFDKAAKTLNTACKSGYAQSCELLQAFQKETEPKK